jgi:hypothetical protein
MATNYIIDPYGIFGTTFLPDETFGSQRFKKIEYLKKNAHKYNGYILGSSRAAVIDPADLERHLPGSHFYNLGVSNSNIWDQLLHVRYLIKQNYPIKHIFLQYDLDSPYAYEHDKFLFRPHPEVIGKNPLVFYLETLALYPTRDWKNRLKQGKRQNQVNVIPETGVFNMHFVEKKFNEDPDKYIGSVEKFASNPPRRPHFDRLILAKKKADLQALKEICDNHGIELIVATMPYNQIHLDGITMAGYLEELQNIAAVTDFWDFSGYNEVTTNNYNYYETSHYRPHVGAWIFGRIFTSPTQDQPAFFGWHVTSDTIKAHLEKRAIEINRRDTLRFPGSQNTPL